ncbi:GNAT family N-acetyltransferase [Paenibacillus selenitireducens]|uniref:GNAT family N-acetyltransferase n=1 Tax=Paenibacillus selenitireducens TaxID=1324314 RepID=A0A1T2XN57_9BACL|nr:GNAT family N-acetyltransferase [Paenibacillus selenitireducens]OPA81235.1 GNAT family N-acetyltransferase [Paenibacillus selenitireducens]
MKLWEQDELSLRTLTVEDASILLKWLSDPTVLAYYEGRDNPHDEALIQQHFYEDRDGIHACILEHQGNAIGYVQYYEVEGEEREEYGLEQTQGKVIGMDQFIGEPAYWNQGIGTKLIQSMIHFISATEHADTLVMDPQAWNTRALHVYEKCGFVKHRFLPKHEWHEGEYRDCWVIIYPVRQQSGHELKDKGVHLS